MGDLDQAREFALPCRRRTTGRGEQTWTSPTMMARVDLIDALRKLGCHTTDIGDAFYAADPDWLARG